MKPNLCPLRWLRHSVSGFAIRIAALTVVSLSALPADAQELTATVETEGFSLVLLPAQLENGHSVAFTTYDGDPTRPPLGCGTTAWLGCVWSGELRPIPREPRGSTTYAADYLLRDLGPPIEYGALILDIVSPDQDGDTVPDVLERHRSGSFTATGSTRLHENLFGEGVPRQLSFEFSRSSGSRFGTYTGTLSSSQGTFSFSGTFAVGGLSGELTYLRGDDTLTWELEQQGGEESALRLEGESTLIRNGTTSITIPPFELVDADADPDDENALTLETREVTLQRIGSTYRGVLEFEDGEPGTPWRDYADDLIEIHDPNDVDGDGIPDLSYVPEPGAVSAAVTGLLTLLGIRRLRREGR